MLMRTKQSELSEAHAESITAAVMSSHIQAEALLTLKIGPEARTPEYWTSMNDYIQSDNNEQWKFVCFLDQKRRQLHLR